MANVKSIIAANLSQRQRDINQRDTEERLLATDRLLCNIIRVDDNIEVPDHPGFIWAQEYSPSDDTNPFHVFNDKVQAREGLPVWVGPGLSGRREVLDWYSGTVVNTVEYESQKYLPLHHTDHEWPDFKPGSDVVNVYPRSLTMLRTYPGEAGALTVSASPIRYLKDGALVVFPGKSSLDISASQPASGLALFVGIYLDSDDNTLKSIAGATTGDSPTLTPDSPAFPATAILSANVRLDGDQTTISEVDIVDVRQILDTSGVVGGASVWKLISPDGLTDPVLSADNSGDVTLAGTGDLIVPDLIIHSGDTDTNIAFTDDDIEFTAGNLSMLKLTEAGQDVVDIGDVAGGGDVDIDFNDGQMFLRGSDGFLGVGTITPGGPLHVVFSEASSPAWLAADLGIFERNGAARLQLHTGTTDSSGVWFTDTVRGQGQLNYSHSLDRMTLYTAGTERMRIISTGEIAIGPVAPGAQLHVDQSSASAAQPVLLLDQADVSEEMIEFVSSIGVGNAIEAVGAKTLTTTHFIKVTLPGGLTRYFPVGTIA
jgi:hypothetical protein